MSMMGGRRSVVISSDEETDLPEEQAQPSDVEYNGDNTLTIGIQPESQAPSRRPARKSKQVALQERLWNRDRPAQRKSNDKNEAARGERSSTHVGKGKAREAGASGKSQLTHKMHGDKTPLAAAAYRAPPMDLDHTDEELIDVDEQHPQERPLIRYERKAVETHRTENQSSRTTLRPSTKPDTDEDLDAYQDGDRSGEDDNDGEEQYGRSSNAERQSDDGKESGDDLLAGDEIAIAQTFAREAVQWCGSENEDEDGNGCEGFDERMRAASRAKSARSQNSPVPGDPAIGKKRPIVEREDGEQDSGNEDSSPEPSPPPKKRPTLKCPSAQVIHTKKGPKNPDIGRKRAPAACVPSRSTKPASNACGIPTSRCSDHGEVVPPKPAKRTVSTAVSTKGIKRNREQENPVWADDSNSEDGVKPVKKIRPEYCQIETSSKQGAGKVMSPCDDIDLVLPDPGSRLGIRKQPEHVNSTLRMAIARVQADILLTNAYPDGPQKTHTHIRQAMVRSARELGHKELATRLKSNDKYALALATIPSNRISIFRGKIKKAVDGSVLSAFGLESGDVAHARWLQQDNRFIFGHDYKKDEVYGERAFEKSIFVDGLRSAFFSTPKSFGWTLVKDFNSSLPDKPDEKEIPAAMLALASTAIYAAIDDHKSDSYTASEFSANAYSHIYMNIIDLLSEIKSCGVVEYHVLMHRLYRQLCGGRRAAGASQGDNGRKFLNIKAMPRTLD
ncbi:hypothetical protein C8Q78DRAFT_1077373 [Trametes maxima]|nr:hypothetical protein C8Q78DRAFT_1077373 [Trametes maxima]